MNWRRGAFRLWVCVSVLWVAGVLIYAAPHLLDNTALRDPFVEMPWPTFTAAAYSDEWVVVPVKPIQQQEESKLVPVEGNPFEMRPWPELVAARTADMLIACFSLPVALLGVALAIRWVVRGFRQR